MGFAVRNVRSKELKTKKDIILYYIMGVPIYYFNFFLISRHKGKKNQQVSVTGLPVVRLVMYHLHLEGISFGKERIGGRKSTRGGNQSEVLWNV